MPAAKPPEFRRRAVALARAGDQSIAKIAADLGIAESCLRRWLKHRPTWIPVAVTTG